jgi:hypothetical protein
MGSSAGSGFIAACEDDVVSNRLVDVSPTCACHALTAGESGVTQIDARFGGIAAGFSHDGQLRTVRLEGRLQQARHLLQIRLDGRCRERVGQDDLIFAPSLVRDYQERGTELGSDLFIYRAHLVAPDRSHGEQVGTVVTLHDFLGILRLALLQENQGRIESGAEGEPRHGFTHTREGPLISCESLLLIGQDLKGERSKFMPVLSAPRRELDSQFQIPLSARCLVQCPIGSRSQTESLGNLCRNILPRGEILIFELSHQFTPFTVPGQFAHFGQRRFHLRGQC